MTTSYEEARARVLAKVKERMAGARADARHRKADPEREMAGATVANLRLNDLRALLAGPPEPSEEEVARVIEANSRRGRNGAYVSDIPALSRKIVAHVGSRRNG